MGNNVFSDFDMSGFQPVCEQVKSEIASLDAAGRRNALLTLFGCIDNTTLSGSDTPSGVAAFCRSARGLAVPSLQGPVGVASVCVYPCFVGVAKRELAGSALRVASVAGGFPAGQTSQSIKIEEVRYAVGEGADEVDFVINRGRLLDGEVQYVSDEIAAAKAVCGNEVKLKVIIETGELQSPSNIYGTSMLALRAGADFIKTSTGKIAVGATPEAAYAMLCALREFVKISKKTVGFKAAGGITTPDDALFYLFLFRIMLNTQDVSNQIFRIGTSRLTAQLQNLLTF
jgi:deoxyribose-phosphate aldolase